MTHDDGQSALTSYVIDDPTRTMLRVLRDTHQALTTRSLTAAYRALFRLNWVLKSDPITAFNLSAEDWRAVERKLHAMVAPDKARRAVSKAHALDRLIKAERAAIDFTIPQKPAQNPTAPCPDALRAA